MTLRPVTRRILLAAAMLLLLLAAAWMALSGGLRQLPRALTIGQEVETAVQFACGLLSLLTVVTCFRWRQWGQRVRAAWAISVSATAGLSALAWGPPMLAIALVFAAGALLLALAVLRLLRAGGG